MMENQRKQIQKKATIKNVAQNRKAHFNFFIEEKFECGIVLTGTEVKSLRLGKCNIGEAYASIEGNEVWIKQMHISPYEQGNIFNKDPLRPRKLLLHKKEIARLVDAVGRDGYSLVPLQIYIKNRLAKLELALAKGKKIYDKRNDMAEKSAKRDMDRAKKANNN